jgi:Tfp pilus assembly major pilin PilA
MRQRQQGMTFIGLLCILAVCGIIGYAVMRLIPAYLNYLKVARTMQVTAGDYKGQTPDSGALTRTLEKHWEVEDITGVSWKDIEVTRDESGVSLHVAYDDLEPFIANVSLLVHFDKTVKME